MKEVRILVVTVLLATAASTMAQGIDYAPYDAPASQLTALFGPNVASLDAKNDAAFDFSEGQGLLGQFRNLNIISNVYQADAPITIGLGVNGSNIELDVGDYTYAYTIDYSMNNGAAPESPIKDLQTIRVPSLDFGFPNDYAVSEIIGAGYNSNATDFTPLPLDSYPGGAEVAQHIPGTLTNVEFSYPSIAQVQPRDKVMVFLFVTEDTIWRQSGGLGFGDGGSVIGGGQGLDDIPVLMPVVPEPATAVLGGLVALVLLRRRI